VTCTPTNITTGLFINNAPIAWSTAASTTRGDRTANRTTTGLAGLTVTGPTGSLFHTTLGVSKYMFFGNGNHLLILESSTGAGPVTHTVTCVDFTKTPPDEVLVLTALANSSAVSPPNIQWSQNSGDVFFIFAPTGSSFVGLRICKSASGETVCVGPTPYPTVNIQLVGEATATQLRIKDGGTVLAACARPSGRLDVSPPSQTFPSVAVGGCGPQSSSQPFTLRNDGDDCLTITAIANVAPFAVSATSRPLPAVIAPTESLSADIRFSPSAPGSYSEDLIVTRSPAAGDDRLVCQGLGNTATPNVSVSTSGVAFGNQPVGTTETRTITITNGGTAPAVVSVAGPPSGSDFNWTSMNEVTVGCGASVPIQVQFTPSSEGARSGTLSVTWHVQGSTASSSRSISLTGSGCVPNAEIVVPTAPFPAFGQIQRGFRMVRFIIVTNSGDGPLTFSARIAGADAILYSLIDPAGSVTSGAPTRNYTVNPIAACGPGPAGSGQVSVAVVFFANDVPRVTSAELVIEGHNATNAVPASWTFPLSAEIVAGIALDATLVLDRSGSMSDPLGIRQKTDACIAAGQLFVELMRPDVGDRISLVRFNEQPDVVEAMTDVTSANQSTLAGKVNPANLAPSGWTAIAAGAMVGAAQFIPRVPTPPLHTRGMVVLTDGMDNTAYQPPGSSAWYTVLGGPAGHPVTGATVTSTPMPMPAGIRVYGIGLGRAGDIDQAALNALSTTTGGYYGVVGDLTGPIYFNLEKYFTQVFMDMVSMPPLLDPVYTIQPGTEHRIEFDVLRGDVSAMIVVYDREGRRLPFYALSPQGEIVEPASIPPGFQLRAGATPGARFVEFQMPLKEPNRYAGRWTVVVKHAGEVCLGTPDTGKDAQHGFVTSRCKRTRSPVDYGIAIGVGSNFRMDPFLTPSPVRVGDPILLSAVVSEAGLRVTGCRVTVQAEAPSGSQWSLQLLDDGAHSDGDTNDGEYATDFRWTSEEGSYDFLFRAEGTSRDGEPVVREARRAKYVEGRVRTDPCCRQIAPGDELKEEDLAISAVAKRKRR
jgi:Abnormal spindle-like microcephaly-assoc'd, ASPM-SPD-2-Hydin/von Willebrand factor type A domain